MNIYMIENLPDKAQHLGAFLEQFSAAIGIALEVPTEWSDCVTASTCVNKVLSALRDSGGIILLDFHLPDESHRNIAKALLEEFPASKKSYDEWFELFNEDENYALCSAVMAVSGITGARVLVCSSARFTLPSEVQIRVNQKHLPDIPWPEARAPYAWSEGDINTFRKLAESHWRVPYDAAARLWQKFSGNMKVLFPTGNDEHHVWWHILNENLKNSSNAATKAFREFAASWNNAGFGENLLELTTQFSEEDVLYVAKTADNNDGLPVALLCDILGLKCAAECRKCKAGTNGVQPGSILLALMRLKASRAPGAEESTWEIDCQSKTLRVHMETRFRDDQGAIDAVTNLKLTPTQQMANRGGDPPGQATLAMDYLRKLEPTLLANGACFKIELIMQKNPLP